MFYQLGSSTTPDHFQARKEKYFPDGHEDIAITCITYLLMRRFRDVGPSVDIQDFTKRWKTSPFLDYAAVNWGNHTRLASSKKILLLATKLIQNDNARISAKQALVLNKAGVSSYGTEWPEDTDDRIDHRYFETSATPLGAIHLAAFFGLDNSICEAHTIGNVVHAIDGARATAIHWVLYGYLDVPEELVDNQCETLIRLLEYGVDANAASDATLYRRWPMATATLPLCIAAKQGHTMAVKLLLQYRVDINKADLMYVNGSTALELVLWRSKHDVIDILLQNKADVNVTSNFTSNATLGNLIKMVPAGLNNKNIQHAFECAVISVDFEKIEFFLQNGANANGTDFSCEKTESDVAFDVEVHEKNKSLERLLGPGDSR